MSRPYQGVVFPVEIPRVTLRFGATTSPYRPGNPHRGVDLAPFPGSTGRPIVAAVAGLVTHVDTHRGLGNYVVVESSLPYDIWATDLVGVVRTVRAGEPFHLLYAHMQTMMVTKGQRVRAGQQLGTIGSTGITYGPHLHLEMRLGDYYKRDVVNPLDMLIASIVGLRDQLQGDV